MIPKVPRTDRLSAVVQPMIDNLNGLIFGRLQLGEAAFGTVQHAATACKGVTLFGCELTFMVCSPFADP